MCCRERQPRTDQFEIKSSKNEAERTVPLLLANGTGAVIRRNVAPGQAYAQSVASTAQGSTADTAPWDSLVHSRELPKTVLLGPATQRREQSMPQDLSRRPPHSRLAHQPRCWDYEFCGRKRRSHRRDLRPGEVKLACVDSRISRFVSAAFISSIGRFVPHPARR